MSCGSVGSPVRGFRLVNRRSASGFVQLPESFVQSSPKFAALRTRGHRARERLLHILQGYGGGQNCNVFNDHQSLSRIIDARRGTGRLPSGFPRAVSF